MQCPKMKLKEILIFFVNFFLIHSLDDQEDRSCVMTRLPSQRYIESFEATCPNLLKKISNITEYTINCPPFISKNSELNIESVLQNSCYVVRDILNFVCEEFKDIIPSLLDKSSVGVMCPFDFSHLQQLGITFCNPNIVKELTIKDHCSKICYDLYKSKPQCGVLHIFNNYLRNVVSLNAQEQPGGIPVHLPVIPSEELSQPAQTQSAGIHPETTNKDLKKSSELHPITLNKSDFVPENTKTQEMTQSLQTKQLDLEKITKVEKIPVEPFKPVSNNPKFNIENHSDKQLVPENHISGLKKPENIVLNEEMPIEESPNSQEVRPNVNKDTTSNKISSTTSTTKSLKTSSKLMTSSTPKEGIKSSVKAEEVIENDEEYKMKNDDIIDNNDDNLMDSDSIKPEVPPINTISIAGDSRDKLESDLEEKEIISNDGFFQAEDSHFFFYFIMVSSVIVVAYLAFHNKNKILAYALEGSSGRRSRRRPNPARYRKLETNLEEVISSSATNTAGSSVVY